jgi:cysteinyl-tRNA synthetase
MRLYDTFTRTEKEICPIDGKTYRFYCCGPTVYGAEHIGNFRTFVLQDVFRRTLETGGMRTLYVRNITDVDDKTIRDSQKAGQTLEAFTKIWTDKFHADCKALACQPPHIVQAAIDKLRDELAAQGWAMKDGRDGYELASLKIENRSL